MTKSKRQLRAEAVERLRELDAYTDGPESIVEKLVGEIETDRFNYHVEIERIVDLLTEEPTNGIDGETNGIPSDSPLDAQSRAEIEDAERSAKAAQDTREKLEEDMREYFSHWMGGTSRTQAAIIGWLDRQAAITRAECDKPNWDYCETCEQLKTMQDEIAELKADNDYLHDCNKKLDYEVREWKGEAKTQRNNFEQATEARKHWQRKYENLKATSHSAEAPSDESELARELGKALAERDMYREKLKAESNRTCTLAYDGKWLICSECGESLQWFGVRTVYKADGKQERALGVDGVKYCAFCGARIEVDA